MPKHRYSYNLRYLKKLGVARWRELIIQQEQQLEQFLGLWPLAVDKNINVVAEMKFAEELMS